MARLVRTVSIRHRLHRPVPPCIRGPKSESLTIGSIGRNGRQIVIDSRSGGLGVKVLANAWLSVYQIGRVPLAIGPLR